MFLYTETVLVSLCADTQAASIRVEQLLRWTIFMLEPVGKTLSTFRDVEKQGYLEAMSNSFLFRGARENTKHSSTAGSRPWRPYKDKHICLRKQERERNGDNVSSFGPWRLNAKQDGRLLSFKELADS